MNALFTQLLPRFATMRLAGRLQDPAKRREFVEEAERLPHRR